MCISQDPKTPFNAKVNLQNAKCKPTNKKQQPMVVIKPIETNPPVYYIHIVIYA